MERIDDKNRSSRTTVRMRTRTLLVVAVCALLLVSTFECKKQNKDSKNKKSKEGKSYKEKKADVKPEKQKEQKVPKTKAEKPVQTLDQPEEIEVDEVVIEAAEPTAKAETQGKVHAHAAESLVETINHHQQKTIIKPRSLKVLNAYEQCKLECKKQRDSVQAQEYVEQLRAELAAAEQALAEEAAAAANVAEPTLQ